MSNPSMSGPGHTCRPGTCLGWFSHVANPHRPIADTDPDADTIEDLMADVIHAGTTRHDEWGGQPGRYAPEPDGFPFEPLSVVASALAAVTTAAFVVTVWWRRLAIPRRYKEK